MRTTPRDKSAAANSRRAFRLRVARNLSLAPALHRRCLAAVAGGQARYCNTTRLDYPLGAYGSRKNMTLKFAETLYVLTGIGGNHAHD